MDEVDIITGQIAPGRSLSGEIDIGNRVLVGLILPTNWSAAAGGISLQGSVDRGLTWNEMTTVAGMPYAIALTAAGGAILTIDPTTVRDISSFKIRSGAKASPVNQTNLVTLQLITRLAF